MAESFARVPPHDLEAEQSLLGAMMLDSNAVAAAIERVQADDFYQAAHRSVFQALLDLYQGQKPCDLVTLQAELRAKNVLNEVGGVAYLSQLLNAVPTKFADATSEGEMSRWNMWIWIDEADDASGLMPAAASRPAESMTPGLW